MSDLILSVREAMEGDLATIVDYYLLSDADYLKGMGVDISRLPERTDWIRSMQEDVLRPPEEKRFFYLIWEVDGVAAGHTLINKIVFGQEAFMHLHLWTPDKRKRGIGHRLVGMSLPHFFEKFRLQELFCEPYALNPAPNATLGKLGFELMATYETTPGLINFHQMVNRWRLGRPERDDE